MKEKQGKTMKTTDTPANRPAYSKRIGAVRVAVWKNASEGRTFFNVNVTRTYRDGETFKESNSLNGLADVACLKEALEHVSAFISQAEDEATHSESFE